MNTPQTHDQLVAAYGSSAACWARYIAADAAMDRLLEDLADALEGKTTKAGCQALLTRVRDQHAASGIAVGQFAEIHQAMVIELQRVLSSEGTRPSFAPGGTL